MLEFFLQIYLKEPLLKRQTGGDVGSRPLYSYIYYRKYLSNWPSKNGWNPRQPKKLTNIKTGNQTKSSQNVRRIDLMRRGFSVNLHWAAQFLRKSFSIIRVRLNSMLTKFAFLDDRQVFRIYLLLTFRIDRLSPNLFENQFWITLVSIWKIVSKTNWHFQPD